mgnify:CR=1 FL=1
MANRCSIMNDKYKHLPAQQIKEIFVETGKVSVNNELTKPKLGKFRISGTKAKPGDL